MRGYYEVKALMDTLEPGSALHYELETLIAELKEQKRVNKETKVAISKAKGRMTRLALDCYDKLDNMDNEVRRVRLVGQAFGLGNAGDIVNECLRVRGVKK